MTDTDSNKYLTLIQEEFARLKSHTTTFVTTVSPTKSGCYLDGTLYKMPELPFTLRAPVNFTLIKDRAKRSKRVPECNMFPYNEKTYKYYSTPRAGCPGACMVLTKRATMDLASQLRYDSEYVDKYPDPKDRGSVTHPNFVEYLQGFPKDWTNPNVSMDLPARPLRLDRLKAIDLFSGIGGLTLASDHFLKTVQYCDIDEDACNVLRARMADGSIDTAPVHNDIKTLDASSIEADVVIGGFPCQDLSTMGKRKGFEGTKSVLFFQAMRIAKECNAKIIILENVKGVINCGGGSVFNDMLQELDAAGYNFKFQIVEACQAGAAHRRARFFLIALRRDLIPATLTNPRSVAVDLSHDPFWDAPFPPVEERMLKSMTKANRARLTQLGNVVNPLQGKLAMRCLVPGL